MAQKLIWQLCGLAKRCGTGCSHISNRRHTIQFTMATGPEINHLLLDVRFIKDAITDGQCLYI